MNRVAHSENLQQAEAFKIENRGGASWWVFCQPLAWDGLPLPTSRPVFFARNEAKARAWVEARNKR